ncbi:MAG: hypothetical protein H7Y17_05465 [Chlorobia bacterium]|nr:hypothetical protein [Fimbriimonadaceae bacterium]
MRQTLKLFAVAALILPFAVAPAQDLMSFLKDSKIPQRIKAADLGEDMRAMKITYEKQAGGGGDIFSMLMNPMMMMMGAFGQAAVGEEKPADPSQAAAMAFFDKLAISWTNGSTIKMFEQDFLVTYSVQVNMAEAMKSKNPPDLSQADLTLTLINTKQIASITPRLDMTKAEWLKPAPVPPPTGAADKTKTISNAKQLALATLMYAADFDDVIPYVQSTKGGFEVTEPYFKNREITKSLNPNGAKLLLNMALAGVNMSGIELPAETILFYEDKEWPDGTRVVAFTDGHVKSLSAEEWERFKPTLSLKLPRVGKPLPATLGSNWDVGDR